MTYLDLQNKLRALNVASLTVELLNKEAKIFTDLNVENLKQGKTSLGFNLPAYSPVSVYKYGKPMGPIRLYDTGAFYASLTFTANTEEFVFSGTDLYNLEDRYSENIYGITTEQKLITNELILGELATQVKEILGQ